MNTVEEMKSTSDRMTLCASLAQVDYGSDPVQLRDHFASCGAVTRVTILVDKYIGHPKGFFVFCSAGGWSSRLRPPLPGSGDPGTGDSVLRAAIEYVHLISYLIRIPCMSVCVARAYGCRDLCQSIPLSVYPSEAAVMTTAAVVIGY
eukprot:GHVU01223497.1.p2 GENE.GHVU01223497.1~~GHVU01223497.1.p2  ORF type:complete len:147 (+),score=9.26 GHVU01223497.1:711-1151(+)